MLEGLHQMDWSRLSHAYGDASDVPELISGLAAGSEETRTAALDELFGNICHQGSVYEATAVAVPFLIEIVADPTIPGRDGVLHLLQAISEGWLECEKYAAEQGKFLPPAIAARHAQERPHYQAAHIAVARGFDVLAVLLSDDEAAVRAGSAFVLATLTERFGDVASMLLDAIDIDQDEWCCGAFLLALLVLVQNSADRSIAEVAIRRFEMVLEESDSRVEALSAGIALLRLGRDTAIPRVLALARPRLVEDRDVLADIPWNERNTLFSLIDDSLAFAPRQRLKWIIEGMNHADRDVRSSAMMHGLDFCETFRWGPAELVPIYVKLIESPAADVRSMAIRDLGRMGAAGVSYLKTLAKHPLSEVRNGVAEQLKRSAASQKERESWLREQRAFLLPSVSALLRTIDRHRDSPKWDDEQKVREAVINLGFHGPRAAAAIEQLKQLTTRDNPWIRIHAIRAMWKITQDPTLVVPLLHANLRPEPAAFLVLDCLKQIGARARSVVPELRRTMESEQRFFPHWGDPCALDEAFSQTCAETIRLIESGV